MVIGGPGAAGVTARKYVEEENLELGPVLMEAINVMDSVKIAGPANLKNTHTLVSHRIVKLFTWKMENSLELQYENSEISFKRFGNLLRNSAKY